MDNDENDTNDDDDDALIDELTLSCVYCSFSGSL